MVYDMNNSIFSPQFKITTEMQANIEELERHRWLIDNMLIMPKHEARLRRETEVRRISATTRIDGGTLNEGEVRALLSAAGGAKLTVDERANVDAQSAYEFVDFLSDQPDIPVDELVIRQLNRYFMSGGPEALTPGAYRKGPSTVGSYTPPGPGDLLPLMRSFAFWLRNDELELHPVIKAGIAHIHLVAVQPFWDGNGRTARGLATMIGQRSALRLRKLLSPESSLLAVRDIYFSTIERTLGCRFSLRYDATPWLEFFVRVMRGSVEALVGRLTDWHRMMQELYDRGQEGGLVERQVDGHMFAIRSGRITRSDYIEITGVSPVTASRDLALLVEAGLLVPEGKTRARIYRPAPVNR